MNRARRLSLTFFAVGLCALLAPDRAVAASKKVDLNSATQQELETLPGVGEAIAKKIIAGRPYSSVADLARAGVPDGTIQKITPLARAGRTSTKAEKPASAEKAEKSATTSSTESASPGKGKSASAAPASSASSSPVDLNSAGAKDLEALPGVGPATAKKIIAGRPYAAVAELSRAGVSASTIAKISPLVRVSAPESTRKSTSASSTSSTSAQTGSATKPAPGRPASSVEPVSAAAPASAAPSGASAPAPAAAAKAKPAPSADAGGATYQPPPSAGMVWVNLDSKVFHREGDRWYGKTKHGKYMSEADAVAAGYRASKQDR